MTQNSLEHYRKNKLKAVDIGTSGRKQEMFAPPFYTVQRPESVEYLVKYSDHPKTKGEAIELHFERDGDQYYWEIGHTNTREVPEGAKVKTGDFIGWSGGCKNELKLEEASTGCHVHIQLFKNGESIFSRDQEILASLDRVDTYTSEKKGLHAVITLRQLIENGSDLGSISNNQGVEIYNTDNDNLLDFIKTPELLSKTYQKKEVQNENEQNFVKYASKISNNNIQFLSTIQGENSLWTHDRLHRDGHGWGFCGFDDRYWQGIIDNPKFLNDPYWQMNQCWEHYQRGTRFYARDRWKERATHFELI